MGLNKRNLGVPFPPLFKETMKGMQRFSLRLLHNQKRIWKMKPLFYTRCLLDYF